MCFLVVFISALLQKSDHLFDHQVQIFCFLRNYNRRLQICFSIARKDVTVCSIGKNRYFTGLSLHFELLLRSTRAAYVQKKAEFFVDPADGTTPTVFRKK